VLDIKGEVYAHTAEAWRAMGQEVHVLDLRDEGLPGALNPVDLVALSGGDPVTVARNLAADLMERSGKEAELFWIEWGETMLAAGFAWLMADCPKEERTLSKLFDLYHDDDVVYRLATLLDKKDPLSIGRAALHGRRSSNCPMRPRARAFWAALRCISDFSTARTSEGSRTQPRSICGRSSTGSRCRSTSSSRRIG
jgi:hypothetical protein